MLLNKVSVELKVISIWACQHSQGIAQNLETIADLFYGRFLAPLLCLLFNYNLE